MEFLHGGYENIIKDNNVQKFQFHKDSIKRRVKNHHVEDLNKWDRIKLDDTIFPSSRYNHYEYSTFITTGNASHWQEWCKKHGYYENNLEKKRIKRKKHKENKRIKKHMNHIDWVIYKLNNLGYIPTNNLRINWRFYYYIVNKFHSRWLILINNDNPYKWNREMHSKANDFIQLRQRINHHI